MMPSMQIVSCDSERPNSWATHRTLTIPESCIQGLVIEAVMANALCCVYTHVVVVDSGRAPYLETYDGSIYGYDDCSADNSSPTDTYTSTDVMEDVIGSICGMSMGSRDCFNQQACIEAAQSTTRPFPTDVPPEISAEPSPTGSRFPAYAISETLTSELEDNDDDNSPPTPSPEEGAFSSSPPAPPPPPPPPAFSPPNETIATILAVPSIYDSSSAYTIALASYTPMFFVCVCCWVSAFHFLFFLY